MATGELEKTRAAIHGGLMFAALMVVPAAFPDLLWPWPLALPLLTYGAIVAAIGPLRRTAPRIAIGRIGGWPLLYATVLGPAAMAVLVGFQAIMQSDLRDLAAKLPVAWFGNLFLAGVCFSVFNAALEELIFRGILWDAIADEWNGGVALVATTLLFGIGHLQGYPPGLIGGSWRDFMV